MKFYYITFRSVTFAQKGERALKQAGLDCVLQRTPRELSGRGCGYCLRLHPGVALRGVQILEEQKLEYSKFYAVRGDGSIEEIPV